MREGQSADLNLLTHPLLHIVLDRPRIAANIASIVRLAAGTCCVVHVCGPLVFEQSDKTKWRAGLDYFFGARVHFHQTLERCLKLLGKEPWIIEVGSQKAPWEAEFAVGDVVIFGPETESVESAVQDRYQGRILTLPQIGPVRSLNLAQCVAVVAFEATRQKLHRQALSVSGFTLSPRGRGQGEGLRQFKRFPSPARAYARSASPTRGEEYFLGVV